MTAARMRMPASISAGSRPEYQPATTRPLPLITLSPPDAPR